MNTNISLKYKVAKVVIGMAALLPMLGFAAAVHADTTDPAAANASSATVMTANQNGAGGAAAANPAQVSAFCAAVDSSTTTLDQLISQKEADYDTGKAALTGALAASRTATDAELYSERVAANADYAAQFKTLAASATTPAQQAAVTLFRKTVTQAIATRRANVDLAIQNYRDGVDAILASRDATYTAALATLKTAPTDLVAGAESTFDASVANIGDASTDLSTLALTRDTKIAAAGTKFSTVVDAAAATLKTALGQ